MGQYSLNRHLMMSVLLIMQISVGGCGGDNIDEPCDFGPPPDFQLDESLTQQLEKATSLIQIKKYTFYAINTTSMSSDPFLDKICNHSYSPKFILRSLGYPDSRKNQAREVLSGHFKRILLIQGKNVWEYSTYESSEDIQLKDGMVVIYNQ